MAGENLHRHRKHAEQQPACRAAQRAAVSSRKHAVDCEKNERRPYHRAKVRRVTREDVKKIRPAEHHEHAGEKSRFEPQSAEFHPGIREHAHQVNMQRNAPVDRLRERKNKIQRIRRIKQRRLKPAEKGRSTEDVRIPECQISLGQFLKSKAAPADELQIQIGVL
ncbi:MAG TPA: hypothetical protein VF430_01155, partial [Verrucomicrobiae bacterium]